MTKFTNPTLFSKEFNVPNSVVSAAGLVDTYINVDTRLFIDPTLLEKSSNPIISGAAYTAFRTHFSNIVRLLAISKKEDDPAWKAAKKLLDLREPPQNGLGYGGSSKSGSSRPEDLQIEILRTLKQIVDLGSKDPEMISLMGFFEEGVGPDTISDLTTRVIFDQLAEITQNFCSKNGIKVTRSKIATGYSLPVLKVSGSVEELLLVPKDIVRDLPIANDRSEIVAAAIQNSNIRNRVNSLLASITKPTVTDTKYAVRNAALSTKASFEDFLAAVKAYADNYDPNVDALGYYNMASILASAPKDWVSLSKITVKSPDDILDVVMESISQFSHHVENGNLWEELWIGDKPKRERAAQLIFFAISEVYMKANNIDISPEANMGGGPVDFKYSSGFNSRVLVELKRSNGTVVHGYEKQLEFYKTAASSDYGVFVVIDYGDSPKKIQKIRQIQSDRLSRGERASEIVVVDARKKLSASKRN